MNEDDKRPRRKREAGIGGRRVPLREILPIFQSAQAGIVSYPEEMIVDELRQEMSTHDPTEFPLVVASAARTETRLLQLIAPIAATAMVDKPFAQAATNAISGAIEVMTILRVAAEPEEVIAMAEFTDSIRNTDVNTSSHENRWNMVREVREKLRGDPSGFELVDDLVLEVRKPGSRFTNRPFDSRFSDREKQLGVIWGVMLFRTYSIIGSKHGLGPEPLKKPHAE